MDAIISNLVNRFEKGTLTRRDLIQALAMLTVAGGTASQLPAQDAGIKAVKIDHISIQVSDLPGSIVSEDKPNEIVRLGAGKVMVSLHHKSPTGLVDHFALGVEKFDKETVTRQLKERGVTPQENLDAGFHIKDPQGIGVQIVAA
jgi:hypothetical protein